MILLDTSNVMLVNILKKKTVIQENGKVEAVDASMTDDDRIRYHIATASEDKMKIGIDICVSFMRDLKSIDVTSSLKKIYGNLLVAPPSGVDFRLEIDLNAPGINLDKSIMDVSHFRRNLYCTILQHFFEALSARNSVDRINIQLRDTEYMTIEAKPDRVTVTFTIAFGDTGDSIIGKVFIQELKEGKKASQSAPQVLVAFKDPPSELSGLNVPSGSQVGYITFVLTSMQIKPGNREKAIDAIHNFLPYLKYHMKCSKAYLHSRMRSKTEDFIKVLNRARPESKSVEKKTFSGKTFQKT